ncbi:MAG: epoxyqueuosine reductase [Clostridia bacterium]|nr:epoxyqueuosine reductase [Clostridia bacterium]
MNENLLKEKLTDLGADLVGFSRLDKSPIEGQSDLVYAITVAVKLPDAVLKTIDKRPTIEYFHTYRTANALLDRITFLGARLIEKQGYKAFPIPASQSTADDKSSYRGAFSHKTGARLSGLGFIGKNALFISSEFGSKIRLATILTDMQVSPEQDIIENGCKDCNLCVKACPGGAISGIVFKSGMEREDFFSAEKCSNHMKTYKDIGRGSVCGICIKVCPFNRLK